MEYKLVWYFDWHTEIPYTLQLGPLFDIKLTWHLAYWLAHWWEIYLEIIWEGLLWYL